MSTSTVVESTSLYFRDDRSDKVYNATIESCGNGYIVNCSWGRRGSALQSATQTKEPVSLEKATAIYDKKLKEKRAKGYQLSTRTMSTIPVASTTNPLNPQCNLLNPIESEELESVMLNDDWVMQEKMDGVRLLIQRKGSSFTGYSRTGREVAVPENIQNALTLTPMNDTFLIDGELVGDTYYAFDLLETSLCWRDMHYTSRRAQLVTLLNGNANPSVVCVKYFIGKEEKYKEFHSIKEKGGEGVVFKKTFAVYKAGRPNSGGDYLKYKFYKTCSAIVTTINDKRSVGLSCYECVGSLVSVGNCTIPANYPVPELGSVVEVRYLYARLPSHALFQPTYLGVRLDIGSWECGLSQLKYKAGEGDQDDEG